MIDIFIDIFISYYELIYNHYDCLMVFNYFLRELKLILFKIMLRTKQEQPFMIFLRKKNCSEKLCKIYWKTLVPEGLSYKVAGHKLATLLNKETLAQ